MDGWAIFKNVITIFSQAPLEKVFLKRPYQAVSEIKPTVTHDTAPVIEEGQGEGPSDYSGFSQISAAGKACIPCSNDHFSTVAGELAESIRFAKEGGVAHPEVMLRITDAEDQLNALERIDGAPAKVSQLPPGEKALMSEMISTSRNLRHLLKEVSSVEDLENLAALAQNARKDYRTKLFRMQMEQLSPEQRERVEARAEELEVISQ